MEFLQQLGEFSWTTILTVALVVLIIYRNKNIFYWVNKGIPYATPFPFFGSTKVISFIGKNLHQNEDKYFKKYGDIYGHVEGMVPAVSIADPDLVHQITVKDFSIFPNRAAFPNPDEVNTKMLFSLRDDDWKKIRSIVTPTFTSGKMRKMASIINDCIKSLKENISEHAGTGKPTSMRRLFGGFTMDVIATTAFATRIDSHKDPDNPFVKNASQFFVRDLSYIFPLVISMPNFFYYVAKLFPFLNTFDTTFFQKITKNIMKERREQILMGKTEERVDFLQLLIEAEQELKKTLSDSSGSKLGEMEIYAQSLAFFIVGYDTTATAISMTTHLVAHHPEVQEKLYEEITRVLKENKGEINYDVVNQMEYLDAIFSESLRLYPTAPRIDREAAADYKLPDRDIVLKKGTRVQIAIYSIHRNPKNFQDPDKFIPERFLPGSTYYAHPNAYMPFGTGPRTCVAMRFARMEAKMCIASVFHKFKFLPDHKTKMEFLPGTFLIQPKLVSLYVEERK